MTTLSKIHLNFTDGSYSMSEFSFILDEPQIVTGGVLISNGHCTLEENVMVMEFSRRDPSVQNISKLVEHCIELLVLSFSHICDTMAQCSNTTSAINLLHILLHRQ